MLVSKIVAQFKRISNYLSIYRYSFLLAKQNTQLKKRNRKQKELIKEMSSKLSDPRKVVGALYANGIKWFDASEMTKDGRRKYYKDCQMILNSMAFNNIRNYLIATITQSCIKEHNPIDGLNRVRDAQMTINGMELLKDEFESFPDPDATPDEPLEDINQMLNY
jgi:hypothetical protein